MSTNSRINSLAINNEGFAFDPASGDSFMLNETGIMIAKCLQNGMEEDEIITRLEEEYEVLHEAARRDVNDFVNRLRVYKLA